MTEPNRYLVLNGDEVVDAVLAMTIDVVVLRDGQTAELAPEGVGIGWKRGPDGFVPPAFDPAASVMPPTSISDRQFAHQLAVEGLITKDEALAFVQTGTIPAALKAIIDDVPDPEIRFDAEILISGATTFERQHPTTVALLAAWGWDPARADAFWLAASQR